MEKMEKDRTNSTSKRRKWVVLALALALLLALPLSSCQCVVKQLIDKGMTTTRGIDAINAVNRKAAEGYDVRLAKAKWLEALAAYNNEDYKLANQLLDETYELLKDVELVAERLYYDSLDGTRVSGLLFPPREGDGPWPLIVVNHAGFGTAADFSDVALLIRDQGYLVFNPDYRGSGESEGQHELARGEVDDAIAGIEYVRSLGIVDGDRVGLYGQSHGAAVAMLTSSRYPVKAVVEEAGFTDAAGLYYNVVNNSDPNIRSLIDEVDFMKVGTPGESPEEYNARSAIKHVDTIDAPTLIIHGALDPLIPVKQAEQMYDAMRKAGKVVEIKIYPGEAHCVVDPAGRNEVWEMMFAWFAKYV